VSSEPTASELITLLQLVRHPEGGWYRETYRASDIFSQKSLPERFNGSRSCCTAIYFLLERDDISVLHRIKSDELWFFHAGTALTIHVLTPAGFHQELHLGNNLQSGEMFQVVVPAGCWFGAEVSGEGEYALVSCTVAPGFDFADFEMGDKNALIGMYPCHSHVIEKLTRMVANREEPQL